MYSLKYTNGAIREPFKYYFADFVRKGGGGGTPQIRNSFFAQKKSVKGKGYPTYGQNPQSSIWRAPLYPFGFWC